MKLNIFAAAIVAVFFVSCATQRNAEKYYQKHPKEFAEKCAAAFPIKDSAGEAVIDSTKKADNKDYSGTIDSLIKLADALADSGQTYRELFAQSVREKCQEVINVYEAKIREKDKEAKTLAGRVRELQANYRPCISDTVYKTQTIYRENTAKVTAQQLEIDELNKKLAFSESWGDHWRKEARKRFWWIVVLLTVIGAGIVLRIKRVI